MLIFSVTYAVTYAVTGGVTGGVVCPALCFRAFSSTLHIQSFFHHEEKKPTKLLGYTS